MKTTYKTNGWQQTKSLTEWFFGKDFVKNATAKARREAKKNCGKAEVKVFQPGTGFLTVTVEA